MWSLLSLDRFWNSDTFPLNPPLILTFPFVLTISIFSSPSHLTFKFIYLYIVYTFTVYQYLHLMYMHIPLFKKNNRKDVYKTRVVYFSSQEFMWVNKHNALTLEDDLVKLISEWLVVKQKVQLLEVLKLRKGPLAIMLSSCSSCTPEVKRDQIKEKRMVWEVR